MSPTKKLKPRISFAIIVEVFIHFERGTRRGREKGKEVPISQDVQGVQGKVWCFFPRIFRCSPTLPRQSWAAFGRLENDLPAGVTPLR